MATDFPTGIDAKARPTATDKMNAAGVEGDVVVDNLYDAVEAVEAKLGVDGSAVTTSHDYKLSGVTGTDKAVSKTGEETLTTKTLTTPVIASFYQDAAKTKLMTTPNTASDTLVTLAATQTLTGKTLTSPTIISPTLKGSIDGWIDANEMWTYASATTITVPSGAANKYRKGDKIRLQNNDSGTYLYFYIITVADTLLTVTGGSDYAVPNATITDNYYSHSTSPIGFPDYFNYTPSLYAVTTNPTLGSGAIQFGKFALNESTCIYKFHIVFGTSGTNAGSGGYQPSLPVTCLNTAYNRSYGCGELYDSGGGGVYPCVLRTIGALGTDRIWSVHSTAVANTAVTHAAPFEWSASDEISGQITYEIG